MNNMQKNSSFVYSPRTTFSEQADNLNSLFNDLASGFDPYSIKIIKKHFKERLGKLTEETFIAILKQHLLNWHPNLENREEILIKLLSRLFNEIDLNNNGILEWDELTNYIIKSTNKKNFDKFKYTMEHYSLNKQGIENVIGDKKELVSYSFYIEKLKMFGIVFEGKSCIHFFDAETSKKKKISIELKDTLTEIDILEINELNRKADLLLSIEKKQKKAQQKERELLRKKFWIETNQLNIGNHGKKKIFSPSVRGIKELKDDDNKSDSSMLRKVETPENLKKEIIKIKRGRKRKNGIGSTTNQKLTVLTTLFLNEYDTLLVSSSNNKISAWKYIDKEFKNVNSINDFKIDSENFRISILTTDIPQYTMGWDKSNQYLYTGGTDGKILKWELTQPNCIEKDTLDINLIPQPLVHSSSFKTVNTINTDYSRKNGKGKDNKNNPKSVFVTLTNNNTLSSNMHSNQHSNNIYNGDYHKRDSVSCIIIIQKMQLVSASYYNGNIILWDPLLKKPRRKYTDQETGIYQMCFDDNKNLLFTCGFDHKIFIYDPYIDGCSIYSLEGHNASINSISINEKYNELVSMDILGNVKVWDTSNFHNFQTFNINEIVNPITKNHPELVNKKKISSNLKVIFLSKQKKLLIYGDKFQLYQKREAINSNIADDSLVLGCHYSQIYNEIVTISLQRIKVWNIYTGKVKKIYDDLLNGEILAYTFDSSMKRVYLGDANGQISCFNMSNGDLIKSFSNHQNEITNLIYSGKSNLLISFSLDGVIKFQNDIELLQTNLIKEIKLDTINIKEVSCDQANDYIIMGTSKGSVMFYDISRYRVDSEYLNSGNNSKSSNTTSFSRMDPISCLCFFSEINSVFAGYESGKGQFISTPHHKISTKDNNHLKVDFGIIHNELGSIVSVTYSSKKKEMFTGDRCGKIKIYDISELYEVTKLFESEELIKKLKEIKIKNVWTIETGKESVKHLSCPNDLEPMIILSTSSEHHVKFYSIEKESQGAYIDELKQVVCQEQIIPIAIKYADNNVLEDDQEQKGERIIYRNDIDPITFMVEKGKMMKHLDQGTSSKLLEMNAKEKLIQISKNNTLPNGKSSHWGYNINLDNIKSIEQTNFDKIKKLVQEKEKEVNLTQEQMQKMSIVNDNYQPLFMQELKGEQIDNYSNLISSKIRSVKLATVKSTINQFERKNMIKLEEQSTNISSDFSKIRLKHPLIINCRKSNNRKSQDNMNLKRKIRKNNFFSPEPSNNFNSLKNAFNDRIKELTIPMNLLKEKKFKIILPKISHTQV